MSQLRKYANAKGQSTAHLYIDEKTGEFWAVIRVGKRIRKRNLKTAVYIRALAELPIALAALGDPNSQDKARKAAPDKLLLDYWADLRNQKVANEIRESTLVRFDSIGENNLMPYLGKWKPSDVSADMMPDFIAWHRRRKPGAQLVNPFKYLSNLFNYMVKVGVLLPSQVPEIEIPKSERMHHKKKKGRIITNAERSALLANGSDRMKLVSGLADVLGNRKMEIVGLLKSKIKEEDGRLFIELTGDVTKTGLDRILPVPKRLESQLRKQIEASEASPYLFPMKDGSSHIASQIIDKDWAEQKRQAKIKGRLRFHDWRHTRATKMAAANINPIVACTLLGMSIVQYQKTYTKLTGRDLVTTVEAIVESEGD